MVGAFVEKQHTLVCQRYLARRRFRSATDQGDAATQLGKLQVRVSADEMLVVDTFFRRMNWRGGAQDLIDALRSDDRRNLEAYCDGINLGLQRKSPWEFRLLGYHPEHWQPEDTILMARMVGYLTLAQSQTEVERLCVEMAQAGVPLDKLEELFPGNLEGLDVDLLKQVTLGERIVPPEVLWSIAAPRMMASNNWVVSGRKTASGKPILANDPHLEVNRLPNVWCELVLTGGGRTLMGGSMPGLPGLLVGRSPDLAWGATYAFVDASDSWIEQCRDGNFYREEGDTWQPFKARHESIKRKKKSPVEMVFFESDHGVLDGDPHKEGYYLATRWAPGEAGAAALSAIFEIGRASSVADGMAIMGKIESAWNFVFADRQGDIGYQMTGLAPCRRAGISGFVPLPGWVAENDWQGFLTSEEMPRAINPEDGFIVTAEDRGTLGPDNNLLVTRLSFQQDFTRPRITRESFAGLNFTTKTRNAILFF